MTPREALRARCEQVYVKLYGYTHYGYLLTELDAHDNKFIDEMVNMIAAERAAEAALIAKEAADRAYQIGLNEPLHTNYLYIFKDWCEARAAGWREK